MNYLMLCLCIFLFIHISYSITCKVDCPDSNMVKTGINIDQEELPIGCQQYGLNKDVDFFEDS